MTYCTKDLPKINPKNLKPQNRQLLLMQLKSIVDKDSNQYSLTAMDHINSKLVTKTVIENYDDEKYVLQKLAKLKQLIILQKQDFAIISNKITNLNQILVSHQSILDQRMESMINYIEQAGTIIIIDYKIAKIKNKYNSTDQIREQAQIKQDRLQQMQDDILKQKNSIEVNHLMKMQTSLKGNRSWFNSFNASLHCVQLGNDYQYIGVDQEKIDMLNLKKVKKSIFFKK